MSELKKIESKMEEIKEMKSTLVSCLKTEIAKGIEHLDAKEAGEVVDMIKDLAETEKLCYEACYYRTVIEAMEERGEENERRGYDDYRYADGRFAPKGHGRRGYEHAIKEMPYVDGYLNDPDFEEKMRRGYDSGNMGGGMSNGMTHSTTMNGGSGTYVDGMKRGYHDTTKHEDMYDDRYGRAYNMYQERRRHYTETHSAEDKNAMDKHMEEHLNDTMVTIKEMYKGSDPALKARIKSDFSKLVNELA